MAKNRGGYWKGSHVRPQARGKRQAMLFLAMAVLAFPLLAVAARTQLKPGWNMFSPQQDVEVGQQTSREAERQLPMLNNSRIDNYLNNLGRKLATHAPGEKFHYQFKGVNDRAINAFALPGGFLYVNRGVIESADNESQLAGVMAHEIAHVALRHGTNQASKAYIAQMPLAVLGGALGSNSTGAMLAQLGAGFAVNSVLLKYSRTAESQADILATQILHDSGYDPRGMSQFFEKIQAESKGGRVPTFFSSHPNPDNRAERVGEEINNLGGSPRGARTDSQEFQDIKQRTLALAAPPKSNGQIAQDNSRTDGTQPEWPSNRSRTFENAVLRIEHPDNWRAYGQGDVTAMIAPDRGTVSDSRGNQALAYGVIINVFEPHLDSRYQQQLQSEGFGQGSTNDDHSLLEDATDQLIDSLRRSNQNLRILRYHEHFRVNGALAQSTYLTNDSPLGGRETNWLVTVQHPEGLLFMVFVAPDNSFQQYEDTFQAMLHSVQIRG